MDVIRVLVFAMLVACAAARPATAPSSLLAPSGLTVITFFSAHCPVQRAHDARLVALAMKYTDRVRFVAVDSEEGSSEERASAERSARGYPFSIVVDDGSVARALGAETSTFTVIADARGNVLYAGGIDGDRTHLTANATPYLADALDDLLSGKKPRAEGKALGCALQVRRR